MQIESRTTRKSSCPAGNSHKSVNIAPTFDFIVLSVFLQMKRDAIPEPNPKIIAKLKPEF